MNYRIAKNGFKHLIAKRFTGPFWYRRSFLRKTEWMSQKKLEQIQLKYLKRLVRYCYQNVPYYRMLMDKYNIYPDDIQQLCDIKLFPLLTKSKVLAAGSNIVSKKIPEFLMTEGLTGGTTGSPLKIKRDLFAVGNEHAFVRRQWDWAGLKLKDRTAYLSGRVVSDGSSDDSQLYAYDPFMKELILSTYHLSKENAKKYLKAMDKYDVKAIVGYTSSISFLAKCCREMGFNIQLKAALTTSEVLSEEMEENITKGFNCRVFDFYGAAERVCYIFTCERGSYHLIPEYGLTEFITVDGQDRKLRKIVATGFWNHATPLIRYDTGDLVKLSDNKCSCGREFQKIERVIGRTGDMIKTPSGKVLGPTLLARVIKHAENILESQVIQNSEDHVIIPFVASENFSQHDYINFRNYVVRNMPSDLKVDIQRVEKIDRTESGKLKFIVSQV